MPDRARVAQEMDAQVLVAVETRGTDPEALKKINAPILGLFGAQDRGITPDDVHKFEASMKQLGKKIAVHIYDDAGHGFENENNKDGYRADDTVDARKRTADFLAASLKK